MLNAKYMNLRNYTTVKERRKALEKDVNVRLKHIGSFTLDEDIASSCNCENMIGAAQIPLGAAGPLHIHHSSFGIQHYYIPLATTEGALVASVNRGCKAITESGGATTASYRIGTTRGPVFHTDSFEQNQKLYEFLDKNLVFLQSVAAETSGHLKLTGLMSRAIGRYQFVRFVFDTQDAMGMNMVTIATDALVSHIEEKTGATCTSLSGNFCVDKKPAWQNAIRGRGIEVWAEVTIPASVLAQTLKSTAKAVFDTWLAKCMVGSAVSGSMGFNAQFANVVAALFLATGQDPAHVVEGSLGITTCEVIGEDLYISVYLPDLMVGTVGGGTGLATQKEALELLGVYGGNNGKNSQRFAEIVGAAVLAGEISLLSSLEEGSLAKAHQTLARGKR